MTCSSSNKTGQDYWTKWKGLLEVVPQPSKVTRKPWSQTFGTARGMTRAKSLLHNTRMADKRTIPAAVTMSRSHLAVEAAAASMMRSFGEGETSDSRFGILSPRHLRIAPDP